MPYASGPVRTTPIALLQRRNMAVWTGLAARAEQDELPLSSRAKVLLQHLQSHGASFFDELLIGTRLLRSQLEDALGELVALGLVNSDSFSGLRALLVPSSKRPSSRARRGRRALAGIDDAGRWSLVRRAPESAPDVKPGKSAFAAESVEHIAWTLLRRYGVVFWRLLAREADWLPPWRELLRVYHRLEARGEIRGGRFVAGLSGEQFALPDAVGLLRKMRKRQPDGALVCVCGADPLNLLGSVIPGPRVPALTGARMLFRDGVPIATLVSGDVRLLEQMEPAAQWAATKLLLRDHRPSMRTDPQRALAPSDECAAGARH